MEYKSLKKIISSLEELLVVKDGFTLLSAQQPPGMDDELPFIKSKEDKAKFMQLKTYFFFKLERELEKVNAFYLQKESEYKSRIKALMDKKRVLKQSQHAQLCILREAFYQFQHDLTLLQVFIFLILNFFYI